MQWKNKQKAIDSNISKSFVYNETSDLQDVSGWNLQFETEEDRLFAQSMRQKGATQRLAGNVGNTLAVPDSLPV